MKCTDEQILQLSKNSDYHDLGTLPSMGIPYGGDFKLYIRTFKLKDLRLLSKAVELNDASHLLRAVDNVISIAVEELTIGDFFYVMLWLRLYSMPKSPYIVEWKCDQPYFTHKETKLPLFYTAETWPTVTQLKTEYDVEPCNTENTTTVHQANVEVITLDEATVLPPGFDFPRMSCYIDRAEALKDPELSMLAPAIQWFPGATWSEKVAYAETNVDQISLALDLNKKIVHGIKEQVKFNCRQCRIEHTTKIELNALSFFQ